jgi:SOS-response transcriptional repressor LexA
MDNTKNETKNLSRKILNYIIDYKLENNGNSPSTREIQVGCGISSKSVVAYHLKKLVDEGFISIEGNTARMIAVKGGEWKAPFWY